MIEYKKGCVIEAYEKGDIDILIHSCNCFNTMGSGVAKAIKDKYPQAYNADCKTKKGDVMKLGRSTRWRENDRKSIFNLYGQYDYGRGGKRYVEYSAISHGMFDIALALQMDKEINGTDIPYVIGIPKIGCGLGGGDWRLIETVINEAFKYFDDVVEKVVVYEQ